MEDTGDKEKTESIVPPEVDLKILEELGVLPEKTTDYFRQKQQEQAQVT